MLPTRVLLISAISGSVLVVVVVVLSPIDLKQQNQTTKPFVDSHPESY